MGLGLGARDGGGFAPRPRKRPRASPARCALPHRDWRRSPPAAQAVRMARLDRRVDRARREPGRTFWSRRRARPSLEPPGVMFGGARGRGLDFADIAVSIPPDGARQPGDIQLASSPPGNPEHDFVILRADRMDLAQAKANFDARVRRTPGRRVLIFVHGFNTRFEEAVYRFAQIVHDARVNVAPVLFTWPSGRQRDRLCLRSRQRRVFARRAGGGAAGAGQGSVGRTRYRSSPIRWAITWSIEALRQMSIRDHGLSPKIRDVMMASPDIDIDVFRRQIAEIDAGPRPAQFTLFVSRDDRALGLSSFLARDSTAARRARSRPRSPTGRFSSKAGCRSST